MPKILRKQKFGTFCRKLFFTYPAHIEKELSPCHKFWFSNFLQPNVLDVIDISNYEMF